MKASIQVLGGNGYVWDANVARWLRQECGLIGAAVGGVAAFKQQNAVHGLPLELSPEEVALALERGWGELQPALDTAAAAALAAALGHGKGSRKRDYHYYEDAHEDDQEEDYSMDVDVQQQQQEGAAAAEPAWRDALLKGSAFDIPTTPAEAAAANAGSIVAQAGAAAGGEEAQAGALAGEEVAAACHEGQAVEWTFPATEAERHRYWVFRDLLSKGYRLTGGSKFGADFLVYPGDPTLYHAQFCVRLLPFQQPITPAILAAATRGSHQARKHLLIASVVEQEPEAGAEAVQTGAAQAGAAAAVSGPAGGSEQQQGQQQPVQRLGADGALQVGADSRGTGSRGERFRIRYTTIGPVEGFG